MASSGELPAPDTPVQGRWLSVGHLQHVHELSGRVGGVLKIPDRRNCAYGHTGGHGYGAGRPEREWPPREPDAVDVGFTDMKDGRDGLDSVVRFMDNNSDQDREDGYKQANGREQDARPLQNSRKTHF